MWWHTVVDLLLKIVVKKLNDSATITVEELLKNHIKGVPGFI